MAFWKRETTYWWVRDMNLMRKKRSKAAMEGKLGTIDVERSVHGEQFKSTRSRVSTVNTVATFIASVGG